MAIITSTEYNDHVGRATSTDATLLTNIISGVQQMVERYCRRNFDEDTYSERIFGNNHHTLILDNTPVTTVSSVTQADPRGTSSSTLDADTYEVDASSGMLRRLGTSFTWDGNSVVWDASFRYTVAYTAGYSSITMPQELKLVMYELVNEVYALANQAGAVNPNISEEKLGEYSYKLRDVSVAIKRRNLLLEPYRRIVL